MRIHPLKKTKPYYRTLGWAGVAAYWKANASGRAVECEVREPGLEHPFFLRVPSSDHQTYNQVFQRREYAIRTRQAPRVILDAGANVGLASLWFVREFPEARILAVEPEAENFRLLEKNTAPYPNITPVRAALWQENGTMQLDASLESWCCRLAEDGATPEKVQDVRTVTVATLMEEHGLDAIDLLKVDIEGAEKEVFTDPSAWLGKVSAVIVELHERLKSGCNRAFYRGTEGFAHEWTQGENVFLSRGQILLPPGD